MAKARKKRKSTTVTARVVGPILHEGHNTILWKLRLKAPRFPFFIDSAMCFTTKEQVEKEEKKWRGRKVVVSISQ